MLACVGGDVSSRCENKGLCMRCGDTSRYDEGRAEGMAEGQLQERRQNVMRMRSKGFSNEDIASIFGLVVVRPGSKWSYDLMVYARTT